MTLADYVQRAVEVIGALALDAIGLDIITLFTIGGTTITTATVVGTAIAIGASIGLQYALAPKLPGTNVGAPNLPPPEAGHQPLRQTIPPRQVGFGRVRLSGFYVLFEAKTGISYDVIALHHGKLSAIIGYYLNDDVVTLSVGVVDAYGDGRYGSSSITIKTRLGLETETAYTEITSPLSTIWTSAHRGDGIASLAMVCAAASTPTTFTQIYPRGLPLPSVVADCTAVFDARDTTTPQYHDEPNSWTVSSNPVLQVIFYMTDTDRGMGLDYDTLIAPVIDDLMAEADLCDAAVTLNAGGSEPRYASNGVYNLDSDHADVIASILDTCDGWISQNGDGTLALTVGSYRAPTVTLESKHIRGCSVQYGTADEEAVNELTIQYTSTVLDYKTAPGEPWRDETDISERGKTLSQQFALPWVYSHSHARRLAKRRMARFNASLHGTITTTLYGLKCLGERWINVTATDIPDLESVVIENLGVTVDLMNAQCTIKFASVNPNEIDAWDATTEEGSPPTVPDKLQSIAAPVPAGLANNGSALFGPNAGISVKFNDPGRADLQYQIRWRVNGSAGAYSFSGVISAYALSTGILRLQYHATLSSPQSYEVSIQSLGSTGSGSAYCSPITITV